MVRHCRLYQKLYISRKFGIYLCTLASKSKIHKEQNTACIIRTWQFLGPFTPGRNKIIFPFIFWEIEFNRPGCCEENWYTKINGLSFGSSS